MTDPTPEELEDERGLTYEEAARFRRFVERCEAGASKFGNDEMSGVLVLVYALRERWAKAHGAARTFADENVALRDRHGWPKEIREAEARARVNAFKDAVVLCEAVRCVVSGDRAGWNGADLCVQALTGAVTGSKAADRG